MAHIGEIVLIEPGFIVAEGKKDSLPAIGEVVHTRSRAINHYFIVANQFIQSKIPGRISSAYGMGEDFVEKEHPHFAYLFGWMFQVIPFIQSDGKSFTFPDNLPSLHSLLNKVEGEELVELFKKCNVVKNLLRIDEKVFPGRTLSLINLLKSVIRAASDIERDEILQNAYESLASSLRDDYFTVRLIMREIEGK